MFGRDGRGERVAELGVDVLDPEKLPFDGETDTVVVEEGLSVLFGVGALEVERNVGRGEVLINEGESLGGAELILRGIRDVGLAEGRADG